jgi:hypothetical protein
VIVTFCGLAGRPAAARRSRRAADFTSDRGLSERIVRALTMIASLLARSFFRHSPCCNPELGMTASTVATCADGLSRRH